MEASTQLEAGELSENEFVSLEADIFARLREIRASVEKVSPAPPKDSE